MKTHVSWNSPGTIRRVGTRALCLMLVISVEAQLRADPRTMPPGAYLRSPAPNVSALVQQVTTDRAVARRYARLFGLKQEEVAGVWSNMRLVRLPHDTVCRVYYVHRGE